ncbi:MAG TPA: indolepyruvate oxidoreductase subunit beta family protein [Xanthobacteraceae bacterium]|jgi:indolepyruvate ferredoxin oxidoreductase beta subunit|nr:indolepyruvate oxidoreductase subunit beta family protein [Xanthobacteraceae bacterium]
MTASQPVRPITILIAALGGEGGGVLTNWLISAAAKLGFPVQSTSIPGVAQRTGATTYYIEMLPVSGGGSRPVFALTPGIGDIDLFVASELMEAARAVSSGFVTADRTVTIASLHRAYVMAEKTAMSDGRLDPERLIQAVGDNSRQSILFDMDRAARESGAMINAVMLGAIAGSGRLPIPLDAFENAIREDGKAVGNNLRGFQAGLELVRNGIAATPDSPNKRHHPSSSALAAMEREIAAMPALAREVVIEGARRLVAYQDVRYVRLYLDRLNAMRQADERAGAEGRLLREVARHLAVRMSFEDVIRVAQAKIDSSRMARIREEMKIAPDQPFAVVEFLKPGIEEICSVLPPVLARPILGLAQRRQWLGNVYWGMEIKSTSILGFLRFWFLAKLRRFRPSSYRFHEEQAAIESWLTLITDAAKHSPELALEITECARLIKGYGDTHKRGQTNYQMIETRVIRPAIAGTLDRARAVDAIASARTAALVDPEGEGLANCLAAIEQQTAMRVAAE